MVGLTPIEIKYQNMIYDTIEKYGITSDYEDIKNMVPRLNDLRAQVVLLEVFEDIDYPISLEEGRIILLLPLLGTDDIKGMHFRFNELLVQGKDLDSIYLDNEIDPIDLIFILQAWFTHIYDRDVHVFFGTNTQYIQLFNRTLDSRGIDHKMRPVFPIMLSTSDMNYN